MGIVALAFLAAKVAAGAGGDDDVNFETDQFGCKVRQPFAFPFCISVLNDNVLSFDIAKLAQPLAKCFDPGRMTDAEAAAQNSYPGEFSPAAAPGRQQQSECDNEGEKSDPIWIFDFGYLDCRRKRNRTEFEVSLHSFFSVIHNRQSEIHCYLMT